MFPQIVVGTAELVITEPSTPVGRKRGGVYAFKYQVPVGIDKCSFALGIGSPEQKNQMFFLICQFADDGVGEGFPTFVLVRTGLVGPYGQRCIEQQNPLVRPAFEIAGSRDRLAQIIVYFLEDILQGRRLLDAFGHGKTKAVRLSRTVIGILAENDDFGIVYGTSIEGVKNQFSGRENAVVGNSTELKNVILFDKVQVPHYNYVGDSILGYKSHMGAGSITSNVKSDKKLVEIRIGDYKIETRMKKVGAILGDYVEIGCGSVLNPGSIIGRHTNVYPLSSVRGYVEEHSIYKNRNEIVPKDEY